MFISAGIPMSDSVSFMFSKVSRSKTALSDTGANGLYTGA